MKRLGYILLAIFIVSCSKDPEKTIIGKWKSVPDTYGNYSEYEFTSEGVICTQAFYPNQELQTLGKSCENVYEVVDNLLVVNNINYSNKDTLKLEFINKNKLRLYSYNEKYIEYNRLK